MGAYSTVIGSTIDPNGYTGIDWDNVDFNEISEYSNSNSNSNGSENRSNKQGGNGVAWGGIAADIFGTLPSLIQSITGKYPTYNYYGSDRESNTGTWLIVGGVLIVVVVLIVVLMGKK